LDYRHWFWRVLLPRHSVRAYLWTAGYALDIRPGLRAEVLARYPRLGLAEEFIAAFEDQAARKPRCLAAQLVR
jgi:hypothetical protein